MLSAVNVGVMGPGVINVRAVGAKNSAIRMRCPLKVSALQSLGTAHVEASFVHLRS